MACSLRNYRRKFRYDLGPILNLTTEKLECGHSEIEQVMLPRLRGRVFHVTRKETFEDICRYGWVYSKQQAQFAFNPGEPNSYGRKRGWVRVYDLSNTADVEIKEALIRYWFFRTLRNESGHVYLIIAESAWSSLIPWTRASREVGGKEFFVPFVEAWYPGDMPLQLVSDSLLVTVNPSPR